MRPALLLVPILAAFGCGGALAGPPGSDGGPTQPASTATDVSTTETAIATANGTGPYTPTGTEPGTITGTALATNTATESSGSSCTISASNYDQSCNVDANCIFVTTGNWCGTDCFCGAGAINVSALAAFNAAAGKTPVGSGAVRSDGCPCSYEPGPCCRQGQCTLSCSSASDTLPACLSAGGQCLFGIAACADSSGPPDSCAYADETCCLP